MGMIIGLCGFPGAGKSEVRKILVRNFGFEDINSKAVIYQLAECATGVPAHKFADPFYKDGEFEGVPLRMIAAHLGFGVEDLFGQDYLIRQAMKQHRVAERPEKNFVVDSLRMRQPQLLAKEMHIVEVSNISVPRPTEMYDTYNLPEIYSSIPNNGSPMKLVQAVEFHLSTLGFSK